MAKVYAMIANGTEEVECLAVVDLLRRSGVETVLVSVEESCEVTSSHKVRITADTTLAQTDLSDGDVIFLPGGMPERSASPPVSRWWRRWSRQTGRNAGSRPSARLQAWSWDATAC